MIIEIENELLESVSMSEQQLKLEIIVLLYEKKVLSLGKAAEKAGISRLEFQALLIEKDIPLHYSMSDLTIDMNNLKKLPIR